jgi:hypothetical protein
VVRPHVRPVRLLEHRHAAADQAVVNQIAPLDSLAREVQPPRQGVCKLSLPWGSSSAKSLSSGDDVT